jgi:DNA-binding transcriptional ArsR family regulator
MRQIDHLIDDPKAQEVFSAVARERRVTLRKLTQELGIGKQELQEKLYALKRAELVEEMPSSIDDLNVYYLTSDGFSADRKLKRLGVKFRALP